MIRTALLVIALISLLLACRDQGFTVPQREVPTALLSDAATVSKGEQLFFRMCHECHGTLGEGRTQRAERFVPPAPDFHERHYAQADPAYLYWRIEEGKRAEPFRSRGSVMPAWKPHLTEEQIWQLVAYLKERSRSH